ncbi:MAG: BMC domain-containing protein [Alphaproteobacteria bacterium]|nr:BMC domain-containing protein [Alphaproteobacteria bacterium]MCB9791858.1 BMC domain-containing protein [Alphaproteobacteria bacterium]
MSASGIDVRTFTYVDILQPQTAGFLGTVSQGYMPLEGEASLFVEVSPGMDINRVTDVVLKQTACTPGMQVVERHYGALEIHHADQGQVRAAGAAIEEALGVKELDRLRPRVVSQEIIHGVTGYHSQIVNRFRHGNYIHENQVLYILEVHPAGYALIATNEAEKAANIEVLEFMAIGAFGRIYLGGSEAEIEEAAKAAIAALEAIDGRPNEA